MATGDEFVIEMHHSLYVAENKKMIFTQKEAEAEIVKILLKENEIPIIKIRRLCDTGYKFIEPLSVRILR